MNLMLILQIFVNIISLLIYFKVKFLIIKFKKGMQQEWKLYDFLNTKKINYHDALRKYEIPALSFQVAIY